MIKNHWYPIKMLRYWYVHSSCDSQIRKRASRAPLVKELFNQAVNVAEKWLKAKVEISEISTDNEAETCTLSLRYEDQRVCINVLNNLATGILDVKICTQRFPRRSRNQKLS